MTTADWVGVHREVLARPVHRVADAAHLPGDGVAAVLLPLPDAGDEILAPDVVAALAFVLQLALDDDLGGDAGMVGARQPQGVEAAHAVVARQRVHDRVVEAVAHVQRAGDVGRRQLDAERRLGRSSVGAKGRWLPTAAPSAPRWRRVRRTWRVRSWHGLQSADDAVNASGLGTFGDASIVGGGLAAQPGAGRPAPECPARSPGCAPTMKDKPTTVERVMLPRHRLMHDHRPLRGPAGACRRCHKTLALLRCCCSLLTALLAWLDPRPTLRHVRLTMLSGAAQRQLPRHGGQARPWRWRASAAGSTTRPSAGSVENVQRLIAAKASRAISSLRWSKGGTTSSPTDFRARTAGPPAAARVVDHPRPRRGAGALAARPGRHAHRHRPGRQWHRTDDAAAAGAGARIAPGRLDAANRSATGHAGARRSRTRRDGHRRRCQGGP